MIKLTWKMNVWQTDEKLQRASRKFNRKKKKWEAISWNRERDKGKGKEEDELRNV